MKERVSRIRALEQGLFYGCFAAFSLGIALQQASLFLFMILQLGFAVIYGSRLHTLVAEGRRAAVLFFVAMVISAVVAHHKVPVAEQTRIHWALIAFWAITPSIGAWIRWETLHRVLLAVSVPGLIYSVIWLLQPDEMAFSQKHGFHTYPRAEGFVSNPITNAEGLVILACWSLARLTETVGKRERRLIIGHLVLSILIIVFSRVRSGIVGLTILLAVLSFYKPRLRRLTLSVLTVIVILFPLTVSFFGFNHASIRERLTLIELNIDLFGEHPLFGIGPNKFGEPLNAGGELPGHPHNTLIGMAVEHGIMGLAFYLVFMLGMMRQLWLLHARSSSLAPPWVIRALALVFLSYWIFGLFDYNFADTELLIFHSLHWGMITWLYQQTTSDEQKKELAT